MSSISTNKKMIRALLLGVAGALIAITLSIAPWGQKLEERFGLSWLFQVRGAVEPDAPVLLVAVDKASSDEFGIPYDVSRWPRELHARLIRGLSAAGARAVAFDLHFRRRNDDQDPALADAIRDAGNVALLEFLQKVQPASVGQSDHVMPLVLQHRSPPNARLASAAAGLGPFTLPKIPDRVSRFWTFDENAGGAPSLPLLALMIHAEADYRDWREGVRLAGVRAVGSLPESLHDLLRDHGPQSAGVVLHTIEDALLSLPPETRARLPFGELLPSLIEAVRPPGSRYLNFYGPAQTIPTISYAEALRLLDTASGRRQFAGKAVFVGVSSPVQWQLQDEFLTAFSDDQTGMDLSGSEILASAFANLYQRNSIWPSDWLLTLSLLIGWSLAVGLVVSFFRPLSALSGLIVLSGGYAVMAFGLFTMAYQWIPVMVPLFVVAPLLIFASMVWQSREARADLQRIRQAFGHYLPRTMVDRLVEEGFEPLQDRRKVFGICLMTDAQGYTTVAEQFSSDRLVDLINSYLAVIMGQIREHGGEISDIKGDSVMAFWASRREDVSLRTAALRAVCTIGDAVEAWNRDNPYEVRLPTRIGVHCGEMTLARVGAEDHFEQRAVGDIVNTSSRLEQLSKTLGTSRLVSADTVHGVEGIVTRRLGRFVLKGRAAALSVHEVLGWGERTADDWKPFLADFDAALGAFEQGHWEEARRRFQAALVIRAKDGVSAWYLARIAEKTD